MAKTGKKSLAEISTIKNVIAIGRLSAPIHLNDKVKSVWIKIVNSKPATWFGPEHADMLEALCRHTVQAQEISTMIDNFEPSWASDYEGLKHLEKLHKLYALNTDKINQFMRAMRLTHQSVYRADKAPVIDGGEKVKPWDM